MKKTIVLMCIFILSFCNVHCKSNNEHEEKIELIKQINNSKQDSITNIKMAEINRIIKEIEEFNKSKLPELKKLILENFKDINKEELDSLIIIAEPVFEINPSNKVKRVSPKHLKDLPFVVSSSECYSFYLPIDSNLNTVYPYILYPILKYDTVRLSLRLYTKSKLQKYQIEIIDPTGGEELIPGKNRYEPIIHKEISNFNDEFYKKYRNHDQIPYEISIFSIDINPIMLQRCIIFKNKIYSFYCVKYNFTDLSIEEIFKFHLSEIDDCDIDIEFTNSQ